MENEELQEEIKTEAAEPVCENKDESKPEKKKSAAKKAQEELAKALEEAEENKRKWYAVTAEYENYRRRTQNQAAQRYNEGRNDVLASLFPIGDNLERALSSIADENTKQGVDMVLKAYKKVLEGEGVEEINPVGEPFNADIAEAIMAMPAEEGEESGIVKQVYVKGYKKGDKVLRYAQVIVTQ
ncbi:MAG: nucleotide exchange factor GrpE [Clostridia bacterium]|nr:nucleotide exchange factor GrpE [Clostridia bacterium]